MTDEEIAVKLEGHEHEIGSLKHRARDLEEQTRVIQDLVLSVKELAINMSNMLEEQRKQGSRLDTLEEEPGENWFMMKKTIFTSVVSTISGALAAGLIMMAAQYIH